MFGGLEDEHTLLPLDPQRDDIRHDVVACLLDVFAIRTREEEAKVVVLELPVLLILENGRHIWPEGYTHTCAEDTAEAAAKYWGQNGYGDGADTECR